MGFIVLRAGPGYIGGSAMAMHNVGARQCALLCPSGWSSYLSRHRTRYCSCALLLGRVRHIVILTVGRGPVLSLALSVRAFVHAFASSPGSVHPRPFVRATSPVTMSCVRPVVVVGLPLVTVAVVGLVLRLLLYFVSCCHCTPVRFRKAYGSGV